MAWRRNEPAATTEIPTGAQYIRENWAYLESVFGANLDLSTGTIANRIFKAGMRMWFYADVAPAGWTIVAGLQDRILSIKGGTLAYNVAGGNMGGTWQQPNHTLTLAQIPSHTHTVGVGFRDYMGEDRGDYAFLAWNGVTGQRAPQGNKESLAAGSSQPHNHGSAWRPAAAVGIVCQKS